MGNAEVTKVVVRPPIRGLFSFHIFMETDEPLPKNFTMQCDTEVIHTGFFGKQTPIIQFSGEHSLSVPKPLVGEDYNVDGRRIKKLENGRYLNECTLEYGLKEHLNEEKPGKYSVTLGLSAPWLSSAFMYNEEFKL